MKIRMANDMINSFNRVLKNYNSAIRIKQAADKKNIETVLKTDALLNTRYSSTQR